MVSGLTTRPGQTAVIRSSGDTIARGSLDQRQQQIERQLWHRKFLIAAGNPRSPNVDEQVVDPVSGRCIICNQGHTPTRCSSLTERVLTLAASIARAYARPHRRPHEVRHAAYCRRRDHESFTGLGSAGVRRQARRSRGRGSVRSNWQTALSRQRHPLCQPREAPQYRHHRYPPR